MVVQQEAGWFSRTEILNRLERPDGGVWWFFFFCFERRIALRNSNLKPVILADGHPNPTMFREV